jgi:tetratricopeptide (TPR) repeat protein
VAENHSTLGDIVMTRGQLDEAESYYQRALEHARRLATVSEEMGRRNGSRGCTCASHTSTMRARHRGSVTTRPPGGIEVRARTDRGDLRRAAGRRQSLERGRGSFERAASLYATLSKYRLSAACFAKAGLACAGRAERSKPSAILDRAQDLVKSRIGQEIPEEIITLQQMLREQSIPGDISATGSQKLLYAFYELSSLADYADDKRSFFRRIMDVFRELTGAPRARSCYAARTSYSST